MTTLTITAKGQITVNKQLLAQLGAKPGDKLRARIALDGSLNLRPESKPHKEAVPLDKLAGMFKWEGPPMTDEDIDAAIREGYARAGMAGLGNS